MIIPDKTALVLVDLQNDFVHPKGVLGRVGAAFDISPIAATLEAVVAAARRAGVLIASLHYTAPIGRGGRSMFRPDFKAAVPILKDGDFAPGSFGHELIEPLAPSDIAVEKVFPSGFAQSRLRLELQLHGITTLILAGITTNVGVMATFHDARQLGFTTLVLEDGCACRDPKIHAAAITAIGGAAYHEKTVMTAAEFQAALGHSQAPREEAAVHETLGGR
jgi:ureidoacrylate peracid hydrolase